MKKLVKKKIGGEDPKLTKAKNDSIQAKSSYDRQYNRQLNDPNGIPFKEADFEYFERKFNKPSEIRKKPIVTAKIGGTVKIKNKK